MGKNEYRTDLNECRTGLND